MGLLDAIINGFRGGLRIKRYRKRAVKENCEKQRAKVGDFFLGLVSSINPDFIGGGIQGAQQAGDGGYWIHTFAGRRIGSSLTTIEAFGNPRGVDYSQLDYYFNERYHCLIFNMDKILSKKQQEEIWGFLSSKVGTKYDDMEIVAQVLPKKFDSVLNSKTKFDCASLQAVAFRNSGYPIIEKKINPFRASPADIYDFMYPKREVEIVKIGWR